MPGETDFLLITSHFYKSFLLSRYGSVLTCDGTIEMEASLMEMRKKPEGPPEIRAGCITLLQNVAHPISVARKVMDTPHNFLGGVEANYFAVEHGFVPDAGHQCLMTEYAREVRFLWILTTTPV